MCIFTEVFAVEAIDACGVLMSGEWELTLTMSDSFDEGEKPPAPPVRHTSTMRSVATFIQRQSPYLGI